MTRIYEERCLNLETMEFEHVANWSFTIYPGNNCALTVCRNGVVKSVQVKENPRYVFRLLKTRIEGIGGATGIFKYIDDALFNNFCADFAWKILKHCFYDCKEISYE